MHYVLTLNITIQVAIQLIIVMALDKWVSMYTIKGQRSYLPTYTHDKSDCCRSVYDSLKIIHFVIHSNIRSFKHAQCYYKACHAKPQTWMATYYNIIQAHAHDTKHEFTIRSCLVSSSLIGAECRKNVGSNVLVYKVSLFPLLKNE